MYDVTKRIYNHFMELDQVEDVFFIISIDFRAKHRLKGDERLSFMVKPRWCNRNLGGERTFIP